MRPLKECDTPTIKESQRTSENGYKLVPAFTGSCPIFEGTLEGPGTENITSYYFHTCPRGQSSGFEPSAFKEGG